MGQRGRAQAAYRRFLEEAPADDPQRAEVEELIGELEAELRDHPDPPPEPEPAPEPKTAPLPNAPPHLIATPPPPERPHARSLRIAGFTLGAVGLASVGVGIGFAVLADSTARDINAFMPGIPFYDPAKDATYRTDRTVEYTLLAAGSATVATGLVLYLVGRR
jgi:hypothetical protein